MQMQISATLEFYFLPLVFNVSFLYKPELNYNYAEGFS